MKITIVAGARPNFMKIAPITRAIEAARALGKSISYRLVYTGRKDDTSLDASLFSDLDMKFYDREHELEQYLRDYVRRNREYLIFDGIVHFPEDYAPDEYEFDE